MKRKKSMDSVRNKNPTVVSFFKMLSWSYRHGKGKLKLKTGKKFEFQGIKLHQESLYLNPWSWQFPVESATLLQATGNNGNLYANSS